DSLDGLTLHRNQILIAKFIREKVGSIHLSTKTQTEDQYQSKVGLVIRLGPLAYVDDEVIKFEGWADEPIKINDWVWYRAADGLDLDITPVGTNERISCRVFDHERLIRGTVT